MKVSIIITLLLVSKRVGRTWRYDSEAGTATLANEFSQLGIHPASEAIFLHKSEIVPLKILDIRTPAANIIKQEMLACGGDCAIPAGCVVCAEERVDVILLGTYKHYARLLEKLTQMPYFGMAGIKSELMLY